MFARLARWRVFWLILGVLVVTGAVVWIGRRSKMLGASGTLFFPVASSGAPTSAIIRSTGEGNVVLEISPYRLTLIGPTGGSVTPGGIAKIEGPDGTLADTLEIGVRVGDEVGTLDVGALSFEPAPGSSIEADAAIGVASGLWPGKLVYTPNQGTKGGPPGLTIAWIPATLEGGELPVVLTARLRSTGGIFFVPKHGLLREETVQGPFGVWLTTRGGVGFSGGRFSQYGDSGDTGALLGPTFAVTFGAGVQTIESAYRAIAQPVTRERGRTEPSTAGSVILALGDQGRIVSAALTGADGRFELAVPPGSVRLFASLDGSRASGVVPVPAERGQDVVVPLSPIGRLAVTVRDADTGDELPVRIIVHGVNGGREPNFGSHERATGAGPLVDAEAGVFLTPLPVGRYRIAATRGLEYSIDERDVEVRRGETTNVALGLRRVVDTPGWVGCDFHVHARLSFDSSVSLEDRVRSLASAGVDFAVPSEHNHLGSYEAVEAVGLGDRLSWVPGVEVTTSGPGRGHFNVYPFTGKTLPRARHTDLREIIDFVRKESPNSVIQINHPRLAKGIGYFNVIRLDTHTLRGLRSLPRGFDTVEVLNGFDLPYHARIEEIIGDWIRLFEAGRTHWATGSSDSHSVQYVWAGYPRTYVAAADDHDGRTGERLNAAGLFDSLRHGHAFVTSGPLVEVRQGDAGPGDTVTVEQGKVRVRVRVRTAPWVDATEVDVLVGGRSVLRRPIAAYPLRVGPATGSLEEARREAIRFDEELLVPVEPPARTLIVVVRGSRSMGDQLPFMPFAPLAVTNPMLLHLSGSSP